MSEKKEIKRAITDVWDRVKTLRSERAKLYGPVDVNAAAEALSSLADELHDLAKQSSSLRAMPPVEPETAPKARKKKRKDSSSDA